MSKSPSVKPRTTGTLGPVADLESHLPPEWWRELFDALYLKTDGDVVENDQNTTREVDILVDALELKKDETILDLCCGQGRHSIELAKRGYAHVHGFDRSQYLIRLARRRAKQANLNITFRQADARAFKAGNDKFDCVYMMGNSFGYFDTEEDDMKVLEEVRRVLKPTGRIAMDITDGDWVRENFRARTWEWIDQNHFVCRERSLTKDRNRLVTREVVTHAERGVIADQFYAERLYSRERIQELLESAGFRNVRIDGQLFADSTRGHDLGMMENRIFLVADAPLHRPHQSGLRSGAIHVGVLMGDPRRPDQVKLGGKFNPEDLATIEKLKTALNDLSGYTFEYFDDHSRMAEDINSFGGDLFFNLCDEGFNNDALKELHVPALLEMAGQPYTGAGPACLAKCYDKFLVTSLAASRDIPVPEQTNIGPSDQAITIPATFPALVKPSNGDSSIGITQSAVVHDAAELMSYIENLRETLPGRWILVQEYLDGREFSVALVGNPETGITALPLLEVDYSKLDSALPKILGYESNWDPDSPYWTQIGYVEAELKTAQSRLIIDQSIKMFGMLECRDYARFDFRADRNGVIKLLEVNPNPGWCWDGKFNLMAAFDGLSYSDLLNNILDAATNRMIRAGELQTSVSDVAA